MSTYYFSGPETIENLRAQLVTCAKANRDLTGVVGHLHNQNQLKSNALQTIIDLYDSEDEQELLEFIGQISAAQKAQLAIANARHVEPQIKQGAAHVNK